MKPRTHLALVTPPEEVTVVKALEDRSDDQLMLLARGGSRGAFETLVRRHQARVLAVASRRLGDASLAADVGQNAFLEIYRSLSRYQARGRFPAFLYRVLLNQCKMAGRSARVEERGRLVLQEAEVLPDEAVLAREWQRDLDRALLGLSEKLRDVVILRYSADLAYDEVAEALGVPVGTVKRRLFDAMAKLRASMGSK